jgi:site-specific DNA-methyltransferase (adenine-specific)
MRQIVRAALPLGEGVILDPFMGGGATIAAACAVGYRSIGIERDAEFYAIAAQAVPRLAALVSNGESGDMGFHRPRSAAVRQTSLFG